MGEYEGGTYCINKVGSIWTVTETKVEQFLTFRTLEGAVDYFMGVEVIPALGEPSK